MKDPKKTYCTNCERWRRYILKRVTVQKCWDGKMFGIPVTRAFCKKCGEKIFVPGICNYAGIEIDDFYAAVNKHIEEREEKMAAANIPMYVDYVYEIIKADCAGLGSIYEEYIRNQVGTIGLNALLENHLLVDCGMEYGKQKYALVGKES